MRTLLTFCACLMSLGLCSQNPNWLAQGAVLDYASYDWSGGVEFSFIKITDAYFENETDVRVLERSWLGNCTSLPAEVSFKLHRRGDEVFYVHTDQIEYLLYDFGALPGDSISAIVDIDEEGDPMFTTIVVESIEPLFQNDTILYVQRMDWGYSEYLYYDVIIDIGATGPLFPEYALADPGCRSLASYSSSNTGTLCFDEIACQLIRTDFDYSPFRTDQSVYYEDDQGRIYSIQLSDQNSGNEPVVLVPSPSIVNKWDDCIVVDQFGWAFDRVELHDTTRFDIYNIRGEPITIFLDRNVGEEWICYAQGNIEIKAFVKNLDTATILTQIDSIMTIGFNFTSDPQSGLNDIEMQISKSRGIVQILSFLHFPDYSIVGETYEKLGALKYKGKDLAMYFYSFLNATWNDVNDHNPGDELHVEQAKMDIYGIGHVTQSRLRYVDMLISPPKKYHVWAREVRSVYSSPPEDDVVTWIKDTITVMYQFMIEGRPRFDVRPGITISLVPDTTDVAYSYGGLFNGHPSKTLFPTKWMKADNCWGIISETPPDLIPPTYISDLGGPYYNRNGLVIPDITDYRELKYYRLNSGEEWGEPFDFIVATSNPDEPEQIEVYPNPANDFIYIEGDMLGYNAQCEIYDLGGHLRLKENNISSGPINVSTLEAGIYFYKITDHNATISGKLVIAK